MQGTLTALDILRAPRDDARRGCLVQPAQGRAEHGANEGLVNLARGAEDAKQIHNIADTVAYDAYSQEDVVHRQVALNQVLVNRSGMRIKATY